MGIQLLAVLNLCGNRKYLWLAGVSALALFQGWPTFAQDRSATSDAQASGTKAVDSAPIELVVTGTHIQGGVVTGPVVEITRSNIEAGGFSSISQALASLPMNFNGGVDVETSGQGSGGRDNANINLGGASSANLRGLGPEATLVLLDGVRLPPKGDGVSVDLSLIPLSIISRIEVLADGASAVYGSDAVGGVVNLITRHDFDGMETRFRYGEAEDGKPDYQASQLTGLNWAGGNIEIGYEHDDRGNIGSSHREATSGVNIPAYIYPEQQQDSIFVDVDQIIQGNIHAFLEAFYSNRDTNQIVSVEPPGSPGSENDLTKNKGGTAIFGLRNETSNGWHLEALGTYGRTQAVDDATADALLVSEGFASRQNTTETQTATSGELRASRSLFPLPAGDVRVAFGTSYRSESASLNSTNGADHTFSRNIYSAYGELGIPIVGANNALPWIRSADLSAAGRVDHYSDFGTTMNPRVGIALSPSNGITVRGTYSTSFRAPNNVEESTLSSDAIIAISKDPLAPSGTATAIYLEGSNPNLKPETARNFTGGLEFKPPSVPGLDLNFDYYNIRYRNRIVSPDPEGLGFANVGASTVQGLVTRNPTAAEVAAALSGATVFNFTGNPNLNPGVLNPAVITAITDARYQNQAQVQTDGIDAAGNYNRLTPIGQLSVTGTLTYIIHLDERLAPDQPVQTLANTIYNPVGFRSRASLSWSYHGWSAAAFMNYVNSYKDNTIIDAPVRIGSWTTFDLHEACEFEDHMSLFGNGKGTLSINVTNVFNRNPPHTNPNPYGFTYDPTNSSAAGRFISLELTKRW